MGTLGKVILGTGNFVLPNEEVQDHEQQPQFLPRLHWPAQPDAIGSQAGPALGLDIDWLDAEAVGRLEEETTRTYPRLMPMPPFGTADGRYDGCRWSTHLAVAHNLFHKKLRKGKAVNAVEMAVLVRIVTYGLFHSTTFFAPFIVDGATVRSHLDPNKIGGRWELQWPIIMSRRSGDLDGGANFGLEDRDWSRRRIWTRRWVVVPVRHGARQWGMTVFDRHKGHLYIFDCGDEASKGQRVKAAVRVWLALLRNLGQPYSFLYFVPRVTRQSDEADSGLLCVVWLMEALRNQVGRPMTSRDDGVVKVNLVTAGTSPPRGSSTTGRGHNYISSLRLRDWVPRGCHAPRSRLMAVRRIIGVMVANELGLREHESLTKRYRDRRRQGGGAHHAALWLLKEAARELVNGGGAMPKGAFFTGQGGPQFALPMCHAVLPYDAEAPRRHPIRKLPGRVHQVRTTPDELNAWAETPFDWPDDSSSGSSSGSSPRSSPARLRHTSPTPALADFLATDGLCDASRPDLEFFGLSPVRDRMTTRLMSRRDAKSASFR
ncbi:uncharacterized protein MAM_07368 [Metarhizium album ARSEF 1941]|uniref:Uncharacterized protein n=1 Tax=Metarhizium album (strain ARSEF 1941) TaxID=1081103 RepID=A0A0B2WMS5_METAS|nr:uncharacterized protein MAM_07368 [Metarhizium album ARSEF 1941]KHN94772.1 hypothetical protein MAM_07368 [Metarhizium album ARSEF 1941]